jgi:hypothetical protein
LRNPRSVVKRKWYVYHYDREALRGIKQVTPKARFTRFRPYLERYIRRDLKKLTPEELREDDRFFKRYYFDHNHDPELAARWARALAQRDVTAAP